MSPKLALTRERRRVDLFIDPNPNLLRLTVTSPHRRIEVTDLSTTVGYVLLDLYTYKDRARRGVPRRSWLLLTRDEWDVLSSCAPRPERRTAAWSLP